MENKEFMVTKDLVASRGQRFLNYTIDLVVQYIIWISILETIVIFADISNNDTVSERIKTLSITEQFFSGFIVLILYYALMEIYFSRTIAKYFTKTFVVMRDGSRPNVKTILKRTVSRLIPFEPFSFLGDNPMGWHDRISHTYVVKKHQFNNRKKKFYPLDEIGDNLI